MFLDGFPNMQATGMPGTWESGADRIPVCTAHVAIEDMAGVFEDEAARAQIPGRSLVYSTQIAQPVKEGAAGGLFYGHTMILPGEVGSEFFMTRGHFHFIRDRAEYYWCLRGEGILLLMNEDRRCRAEPMHPGSMHYIPGNTAHRTVNTGHEVLSFTACWPADAGHDYGSIASQGFPVRVLLVNGRAEIVEVDR